MPDFNLYNRQWPIRTNAEDLPPAKFIHDDEIRVGQAIMSIVADGTIVSGASVRGSVLGRHVRLNKFSEVEDSILMDNVEIGRNVKLRGGII